MSDRLKRATRVVTPHLSIFKKRAPPVGSRPGTFASLEGASAPKIRVIEYDETRIEERSVESAAALRQREKWPSVAWIDIQGLGDEPTLREVGEIFGIHALALEDVVNVPQRPKVEEYEHHDFFILRMLDIKDGELKAEQISLFVSDGCVLTFQEHYGDGLDPVRVRLRQARGPIRTSGADYLAYALMDTVVDAYFPILEQMAERLEMLENEVIDRPNARTLRELQHVKRTLLILRRVLWPTREAFALLSKSPCARFSEATRLYLRDTFDHTAQIVDVIESYRDMVAELTGIYLSVISNRTNDVMKVLTIMASIFIPLTFLAGIYGMNFEHMPELHNRYGYPGLLALMVVTALGMLLYFRRKGWIGNG